MTVVGIRQRVRAPRLRAGSALIALALVAGAIALLVEQGGVRVLEARLMGVVVAPFLHGTTSAAGPTLYFGLGTNDVAGLTITALCSTIVLIVPVMLLGAALLCVPRIRVRRIVLAAGMALLLVVTANFARYALAAYAYQQSGREGFDLVHRYVGSLLVIAAFVASIVLILVIVLREHRPARAALRRRGASGPGTVRAGSSATRRELRAGTGGSRSTSRRGDRW